MDTKSKQAEPARVSSSELDVAKNNTPERKSRNLAKISAWIVLFLSFGLATLNLLQTITNDNTIFRANSYDKGYQLSRAFEQLSTLLEMRDEEFITSGEYLRYKYSLNSSYWQTPEQDRQSEIKKAIAMYRSSLKALDSLAANHIYYYAQDGDKVIANIDYPEENPYEIYISYEAYQGTTFTSSPAISLNFSHANVGDRIFVAFDNDYTHQINSEYETARAAAIKTISRLVLICIPGLLALILLIWLCGGVLGIDKMWNELTAFLIFIDVVAYVVFCKSVRDIILNLPPWVVVMFSGIFCLIGTALLLILVRNIKNRRLIKGTFMYSVWSWLKRIFTELLRLTPLNISLGGAILGGMMITAITGAIMAVDGGGGYIILLIMEALAVLWLILKHIMRPYDEEVKARLAGEIDAKMKSERLKTELITNVSHDLKTPLTAILNYSDLLLKRDKKDEYAKIINEKAKRLRALTEDLFDVSKAQSGNIEAKLETLDLAELIDQTLAELDIHSVDFKINLKERVFRADGTLMARVFSNLVGNIVKYSLEGTRAYIDSFEQNDKMVITFKNIANYEMNFNSDEIAERFKRGDGSRSTEGNGLGLAIAKSYTEVCGGELNLEIDGDLFKATIII